MDRPNYIRHVHDTKPRTSRIASTQEALGHIADLTGALRDLRIHHETLPPGHRSSSPHAHTTREEFVFVLEGHPTLWIDGELHNLSPGDSVSLLPGTGIAHTVINDSDRDVTMLIVSTDPSGKDRCFYAMSPNVGELDADTRARWSTRSIGSHDGRARHKTP